MTNQILAAIPILGLILCSFCPVPGVAQEPARTVADAGKENLWTREGLDWPSFLGLNRDGKSDETGLDLNWSDDPPKIVWSQRVGEGYGIGSVAKGRYYHFDRDKDLARLRAFHAETGKKLWEFTYPTDYSDMYGFDEGPRASPVVDDNRVYIFGAEGHLFCLDATTGGSIWEVDTAERFAVAQNFFGVGSTPLIFGDLLIAMIGGSAADSGNVESGRLEEVKPGGTGIVAFDKRTGEIRYETVNDLASYASPVVAEMDGKMIGFAFSRSGLFSFDAKTGTAGPEIPYRARKIESVNASTPVVHGSKILITESYGPGGAVFEFSTDGFQKLWADDGKRDKVLACHWTTPVVVDGFAYASSGTNQSTAVLRCVRVKDGQVMWEQPGLSRSSLTLVDGRLICLTEDGRLFNFKPNSERFEIEAEYPATGLRLVSPCWAAPVISHGYLYLRGKSKVVCLDLHGG